MGMYDIINFKMNCPICGKDAGEFQSKYRECLMEKLELSKVDNFYTMCDSCGAWIEFNRKIDRTSDIKDFEMTATPKTQEAK